MRVLLAFLLLAACRVACAQPAAPAVFELAAPGISEQPLRLRVYLPPGYADGTARYPALYVNDGQDMEAVGMQAVLDDAYRNGAIRPLLVVAIDMPPDRMGAYGLADRHARHAIPAQTRYGPVGLEAQAYSQWLAEVLVPAIDARYRTVARADQRAILGWSLGALNAFSIGWQYPELFGRVGAFSPSFWLAADRSTPDSIQATRLVHRLVDSSAPAARPRLFIAAGTAEETDDRDGDGVIDVVDDARDLAEGWTDAGGTRRKGLRQQGYSINLDHAQRPTRDAAALYLLEGGHHDQASWARMLPVFLRWAYALHAPVVPRAEACCGAPSGTSPPG